MVLLRSCCCWLSLRKGSFASGIYTLIFYTMLVATGICHVHTVLHSAVGFTLILLLLTFSGLCVIFSVVLLLGLFFDNRLLLIPWLTIVSMTTLLDIALSLYFIKDFRVDGFVIAMYVVDYTLCSVNIYCIMCVLSQYQEYAVGRRAGGHTNRAVLPVVSAYNNSSSRGGAGDRSTFSRLASWPSRRFSRKAAFSQSGPRVPHCSIIVPPDMGSGEAAVTSATAGKPADRPTLINRENSLMPDAFGYGIDEISSGLHLSTAETSLQPSAEEAETPGSFCELVLDRGSNKAQLEKLDSQLRLQCEALTRGTTGSRSSPDSISPAPESRPLLDTLSSPDTHDGASGTNEDGTSIGDA
ncbi:uncharacterized protein LOC144173194 isoform X1 [Haemaphysalis longicornis]